MREVEQPVPSATSAVGIDVGIVRFATLSDGSFVAPLNSFNKHEARLRRYQRALSRKAKFSKNRQKAKWRVQNIHTRIGNARRDFLNKTTTTISKNHAMVCIEDLQVKNMSRSSKGNAQKAGKNVRAKSGLRAGDGRESANASTFRVCELWLREQRRCGRRNEYLGAGAPRCSLWRGRLWPGS